MKKSKAITCIIAASLLIYPITAFNSNASPKQAEPSFFEVEVRQDETLWDIANRYYQNENTRKMVELIQSDNNLDGSLIVTGQIIKIRSANSQ